MNFNKIICIFFCLLMTSCSNNIFKDQKITVQKQVANSEIYEDFNEITNNKKVKKAIKIVKDGNWANVIVKMSRYPDYKFQFPFKNSRSSEDKIASYSLWVTSKGKRIEIVTDSGRYVKLSEQESKVLYDILTEHS